MSCNCADIYGPNAWTHTECGKDPCPITPTLSDNVIYNGTSLSCTGIDPNDTFTVAMQKIDEQICALLHPTTTSTTTTSTTTCAPFTGIVDLTISTAISIDGENYFQYGYWENSCCAILNTIPAITHFGGSVYKVNALEVGQKVYKSNATTLCDTAGITSGWYITDISTKEIVHITGNTIVKISYCSVSTTTTTTTILN